MSARTRDLRLHFRPATASRWADIEDLFGERGACGGCWCMFWRLPRKEFNAGTRGENRERLKRIVRSGSKPGVIAYNGNEPIGWCAVAPRADYVALERSRILKPVDDRPVWSVSCLFVKRGYRRLGLSAKLLQAAVEFAAKRGAEVVEGYPIEVKSERMPDPFLWHGVVSAFKRAGFKEVLRRSETRPIMRYQIDT